VAATGTGDGFGAGHHLGWWLTHRVHSPDPGAGQHRDDGLRDHRQVEHHPIALADAERAQHSGETCCAVQ
jgi:hypothetical protein